MDTSKEYSGVAGASRDFFGFRPGHETLQEFMAEWKALSDKDKEEIKSGLIQLGYQIKS